MIESFSEIYEEARRKFVAAATQAGGAPERVENPERGPDGGALSTDFVRFGPASAEKLLVMISGTHGVEGFYGSGVQVEWLARGGASSLPRDTAAWLIHAINPYGFAWQRRVDENNVDLNRNWLDFSRPLPVNEGYAELADALCPADWSSETHAPQARSSARGPRGTAWPHYSKRLPVVSGIIRMASSMAGANPSGRVDR
jgi:hypothetical protein